MAATFIVLVTLMPAATYGVGGEIEREPFDDVPSDHESFDAFAALYVLGIFTGYGDGTMGPADPLSRQEYARVAAAAVDAGDLARKLAEERPDFQDSEHISDWAFGWVRAAVEMDLIDGYPDGEFKPHADISFSEAVTMLLRVTGYAEHVGDAANWPDAQLETASQIGLIDEIPHDMGEAISRSTMAQLVYSALQINPPDTATGRPDPDGSPMIEKYRTEGRVDESRLADRVLLLGAGSLEEVRGHELQMLKTPENDIGLIQMTEEEEADAPTGECDRGAVQYYEKEMTVDDGTGTAQVVQVNLSDPDLTVAAAMSHDRLGDAESFSDMVDRENALAAINANYFHSEGNLEPIGTVASDGEVHLMEGGQVNVGFTEDNDVFFNEKAPLVRGKLKDAGGEEIATWSAWMVNALHADENTMAIFTPHRGESVEIEAEGKAFIIRDGIIRDNVVTPGKVDIPADGMIIFCGAEITGESGEHIYDRFSIGRRVTLSYSFSGAPDEAARFWHESQEIITAGPRLLRSGRTDVAIHAASEEDRRGGSRRRSALGVSDDELFLVSVKSATYSELARVMKGLGAVDAISLDGGASSALYHDGEIKVTPGRELSTILLVR